MKLGLDARTMLAPRPRGTGRNLRDAFRVIVTLRPRWEFFLYHQRPLEEADAAGLDPLFRQPNVRLRRLDLPGDRLDAWFQIWLPLAARRDRIDLLHLPANVAPAWCPVPFVLTVHDLIPLKLPGETTPSSTRAFCRGLRRGLRRAAHIITVSAATREDLHRDFGVPHRRMTVIPWAPDSRMSAALAAQTPEEQHRVRECYQLAERWLLNFSGSTRRKNPEGVLRGFTQTSAAARAGVQLVLVGCEPAQQRKRLSVLAEQLGVGSNCRILGYVPDDDLPALLAGASGLLMPSRYEGFGLPILDAFAAGVPVLTSHVSSLPEVAGDAAVYCDPDEPASIAAGIERLLDPQVAAELIRKGRRRVELFSWQRTAQAMCRVYEGCTTGSQPQPRPHQENRCDRQTDAGTPRLRLDCRHYRGDRPCGTGIQGVCPAACRQYRSVGYRILVIKLGALGDVIRTGALLPGLKRAWPESHITWVTRPAGVRMLANHPDIDRLLPFDAETLCHVEHEQFDLCLSLDKEPGPTALAMRVHARDKRGIGLSAHGTPYPLNAECAYYFQLGLDDELKFRGNTQSYPQLIYNAVGLPYRGERYRLYPSPEARERAAAVWHDLGVSPDEIVVGLNTGAGQVFANKTWPPQKFAALARRIVQRHGWRVALLGGPEERELNPRLAAQCPGLLDTGCEHSEPVFTALVQRCNVLVTGDTLAMHVAIAADVPTVALFGPTCEQEVDLYGCGQKLVTRLSCSPCYRRRCDRVPNCMDEIPVEQVLAAVRRWGSISSCRPRVASCQ